MVPFKKFDKFPSHDFILVVIYDNNPALKKD